MDILQELNVHFLHRRVEQGEGKHMDYYILDEKFINKVDNLIKMLAFNRIFDDLS